VPRGPGPPTISLLRPHALRMGSGAWRRRAAWTLCGGDDPPHPTPPGPGRLGWPMGTVGVSPAGLGGGSMWSKVRRTVDATERGDFAVFGMRSFCTCDQTGVCLKKNLEPATTYLSGMYMGLLAGRFGSGRGGAGGREVDAAVPPARQQPLGGSGPPGGGPRRGAAAAEVGQRPDLWGRG